MGTAAQNGTVQGTVKDANGNILPDASVVVSGKSIGTIVNDDGTYRFQLPAGSYSIIATFVGKSNLEKKISITPGAIAELNFVLQDMGALDQVVVVGTRSGGRSKIESPVPVDIIDISAQLKQTAQVSINQILNFVAPSFSSNTQTISDGTDHIDPASLRGLGPDQVLVLVNGKRRHNSSLINVNGTFGRGNVGTDLNAIPASAIERIEILRDGAAAQYGSDAIAGVINIVLKRTTSSLTGNLTAGAFASKGSNFLTGGLDGDTYTMSLNYGLPISQNGGYLNFTGEFENRDWTSRMKEYSGTIYNIYNGIERVASATGADVSTLTISQIRNFAQQLPYLSTQQKTDILSAPEANLRSTNASTIGSLFGDVSSQELAIRGKQRTDFNMRVGQSALRGGKFFMNMSVPFEKGGEFYAFSGISSRSGNAAGFYRFPNQERTYSPAYPDGFLPEINTTVNDQSVSVGIRGNLGEWSADLSNTFGRNRMDYNITNTNNATLGNATPFEFYAGGFSFSQNTSNFDLSRKFNAIASGFNLAMGAEFRVENYKIFAGSENSYASYDINGQVTTPLTPSASQTKDFFNRVRPGGAQVFPGFAKTNELNQYRNSMAAYIDGELDFSRAFMVDGAVRYENYSDFGSTINFKLASRYKVNNNWSIRGAVSTGFRAPSLPQIYFNSTSTLFVNGIPNEVGTFSNTSRIARILGIPKLEEETSSSVSLGFTGRVPSANLSITLDAYQVNIDDRVILTGTFRPSSGRTPAQVAELTQLFSQANATGATFFANAIDTKSKGIDVVITHKLNLGLGRLTTDLSGTFSKTEKVGNVKTSAELAGLESIYFDSTSLIFLERAVPRRKINLSFNYTRNKFSVFLRNVYFGPVTEATNTIANQQEFSGKVITDLTLSYAFSKAFRLSIGANNIFDTYPDMNIPGNQGSAQFLYSRRSQQFGFNGRYIFARIGFEL